MKIKALLVVQFVLMGLITISPFYMGVVTKNLITTIIGSVLLIVGFFLAVSAVIVFKKDLTVHPRPKDSAKLLTTFPFNISRNPIYVGFVIGALGWAILNHSLFVLIALFILLFVFDHKIKLEESFLTEKFKDEYLDYAKKVRRYL